jgi:putative phosphoesterase
MKKVLFLSDTHGHLDALILDHVKNSDEIWHAGDVGNYGVLETIKKVMNPQAKLRAVKGNIDGMDLHELPEYLFFELEGLSFLMTHIPGPFGRYTTATRKLLDAYQPKIFLCGHSHLLKVQRDEKFGGMLYVNPGAAGIHGFHKQRTMIRMEISKGAVQKMEVIDMGKRGRID